MSHSNADVNSQYGPAVRSKQGHSPDARWYEDDANALNPGSPLPGGRPVTPSDLVDWKVATAGITGSAPASAQAQTSDDGRYKRTNALALLADTTEREWLVPDVLVKGALSTIAGP